MKAGFKVTKLFFDAPAVKNAMDKETRKAFSKFGAYVRTRSRSSIRTRKKASSPGSPPSSHTGLLKRFIFFSYDPAVRSVVIGPEPLSGRGQGDALPVLEYGGSAVRYRGGRRRRVARRVTYAARPFMGPAFETEKAKLPACWSGSLKP